MIPDQAARVLRAMGLRASKHRVRVLSAVGETSPGFTVTQLAVSSGVPVTSVFTIIRELEEAGLVQRLSSERPRSHIAEEAPRRGRSPRRYRYAPDKALTVVEVRVMEAVEDISSEARARAEKVKEGYRDVFDTLRLEVEARTDG